MITQKQIDDYNYMLKASKGIILIKPEEDIKRDIYNTKYRKVKNILIDIKSIPDNCKNIGIGVDPSTGFIYNEDVLKYNNLETIIQNINSQNKIIISTTIYSLTNEKLNMLKKYPNIALSINLKDSLLKNDTFFHNKILFILKRSIINLHAIYLPVYNVEQNYINSLLKWKEIYPKYIYFYCKSNILKLQYIDYIKKHICNNISKFMPMENVNYFDNNIKELKNINLENSLIYYPDYDIDIIKPYFNNIISLETEYLDIKNIMLQNIEEKLLLFRKQNPENIITNIYIPQNIYNNILEKEYQLLEEFQVHLCVLINQKS